MLEFIFDLVGYLVFGVLVYLVEWQVPLADAVDAFFARRGVEVFGVTELLFILWFVSLAVVLVTWVVGKGRMRKAIMKVGSISMLLIGFDIIILAVGRLPV